MSSHVQISQRRNIALCGHGSIGKTSLIDALLQLTGIRQLHDRVGSLPGDDAIGSTAVHAFY